MAEKHAAMGLPPTLCPQGGGEAGAGGAFGGGYASGGGGLQGGAVWPPPVGSMQGHIYYG